MRFHYVASQPNGKVVEGETEAQGPAEVLEFLSSRGLRPISIKVMKGFEAVSGRGIFTESVNITDKVFLTKYLALMLKVGTDLLRAIDILIADFDKPAMKALLSEIRGTVEKGQPFYTTFTKYPRIFSPVFVNLVKAGESSGNLEMVFENLSVSLGKEQDLRNRIRSALVYPSLLFIVSLSVLFLLVSFALPKIAEMFMTSGFNPPLFSKIVFTIGLFLGDYMVFIMTGAVIFGIAGFYYFRKVESGRRLFWRFINRVPVVSDVLKRIALQRFATTLASLMRAGLPILASLEITADAVGLAELKDALIRISREGVAKGLTLGDAFRREPAFPRVVTNLVAISEKAGHIEDVLGTLADFYESEIDVSVKTLVSFLEPIMLLLIGGVIGAIALSIIIPIYQLVGQF